MLSKAEPEMTKRRRNWKRQSSEELEMTKSGEAKETMWSPAAREMIKFGAELETMLSKAEPEMTKLAEELETTVRGGVGDDKPGGEGDDVVKVEPEMTKLRRNWRRQGSWRSWR